VIKSSRGDIKIERLAALVSEAALRAVPVPLRIRLQIRIIRKRLLHSSFDDRVARVVTHRGAAGDVVTLRGSSRNGPSADFKKQ